MLKRVLSVRADYQQPGDSIYLFRVYCCYYSRVCFRFGSLTVKMNLPNHANVLLVVSLVQHSPGGTLVYFRLGFKAASGDKQEEM